MATTKPGPDRIVTANEIMTGKVVFLTPEDGWSPDPGEAAYAESKEEAEDLLARGQQANARAEVELVDLIAATRDENGRIRPTRNREIVRADGPSVRPDLGYAAEGRNL